MHFSTHVVPVQAIHIGLSCRQIRGGAVALVKSSWKGEVQVSEPMHNLRFCHCGIFVYGPIEGWLGSEAGYQSEADIHKAHHFFPLD